MRCWCWWRGGGKRRAGGAARLEGGWGSAPLQQNIPPCPSPPCSWDAFTLGGAWIGGWGHACGFGKGAAGPPLSSAAAGRALYIQGERRLDFLGWVQAIQKAAGSSGDTLSEQQLTEGDVPMLVDRCIDYITQCGTRPRWTGSLWVTPSACQDPFSSLPEHLLRLLGRLERGLAAAHSSSVAGEHLRGGERRVPPLGTL